MIKRKMEEEGKVAGVDKEDIGRGLYQERAQIQKTLTIKEETQTRTDNTTIQIINHLVEARNTSPSIDLVKITCLPYLLLVC
jgi:hypothetical protein